MKRSNSVHSAGISIATTLHVIAHTAFGILAVLLSTGCATHKPIAVVESGSPSSSAPVEVDLAPITLGSPGAPAECHVDQSSSQLDPRLEAAGAAAKSILEKQTSANPYIEFAAGAVRFALAPVSATAAVAGLGKNTLPPEKISEVQMNLAQAMAQAAEQKRFQECLLKTANEKFPRRLVSIGVSEPKPSSVSPTSGTLHARVEEIRLERSGSGGEFVLHIRTRMRLLDADSHAVLYDQPFEFRSGKDSFVDWARHDGVLSVTDTGYRELADQMVNQLFSTALNGPLRVGAGYNRRRSPREDSSAQFVAYHRGMPARPALEFVNGESPTRDGVRFVNHDFVVPDLLGIYSSSSITEISIQRPLTKEEAVSEAVEDVERSLDGLDNSQNSVVMVMACGAAIPVSLWKQAVGAFEGLTEKKYRAADASLAAAAHQTPFDEELASEVARQLTPQTSQPVKVVSHPIQRGDKNQIAVLKCAARDKFPDSADGIDDNLATTVGIHILSAALKGGEGVNPSLALCVEAEATVSRVSDGQPLYTCPLRYRSTSKTFTQWAVDDARPFREELDRCNRQLSRAIVNDLVARRVVAPRNTPQPTLADNLSP